MRHIGVLARRPSVPGKTRLTEGLPPDRAAALRVASVEDTLGAEPARQRARGSMPSVVREAREPRVQWGCVCIEARPCRLRLRCAEGAVAFCPVLYLELPCRGVEQSGSSLGS